MSIIPTLVFPDAVQLVLDRLSAELPALVGHTVATGNRVPSPRPAEFVRVQRQGGTRVTVVTEAAQLAIEAWSTDVAGADQLAQACRWSRTSAGPPRSPIPCPINRGPSSPWPCTCAAAPNESREELSHASGSQCHHRRADRQGLQGADRHRRAD
jgi:hypothetical protein